jgi:Arc/MetJ family transcription regulator
MKMTMHINEDILADVMEITGSSSKTAAVEKALTEMVRKHRLKRVLREGMGMTAEEIRGSYDFAAADTPRETPTVAEKKRITSKAHARKRSR